MKENYKMHNLKKKRTARSGMKLSPVFKEISILKKSHTSKTKRRKD